MTEMSTVLHRNHAKQCTIIFEMEKHCLKFNIQILNIVSLESELPIYSMSKAIKLVSQSKCYGGFQCVYEHER